MKRRVMIILTVLCAGLIMSYIQLNKGIRPYRKAQNEAIVLAQEEEQLQTPTDFYWYNGSETYFTILGTDKDNVPIIVIIKQDGGETLKFNQDDTLSEEEVIHQTKESENVRRIIDAKIGMFEGEPIWEVCYVDSSNDINYRLIHLETGALLEFSSEKNE